MSKRQWDVLSRKANCSLSNHLDYWGLEFLWCLDVGRWSKSPPLQAQARRHGKPHRVQGQIGDYGAARSLVPHCGTSPGYWLLRQMILSLEFSRKTKFGLQPFQNHFKNEG